MHSSALLAALAFVASVVAITVTAPADNSVFSPTSSITLTWTSVDSDASAFQPILVNPSYSVSTVLEQSVQTSSSAISLPPPNGGWPLGDNWKINLMSISTSTQKGGILAQSGSFNITATGAADPNGQSGATGVVVSTGNALPTTMSGATIVTVAATATATGTDTATVASSVGLNPTGISGALSMFQASGTLVALVAVAHAFIL